MTAPAIPVVSKGTVLEVNTTGSTYVAVAGVISLDLPEQETETYESDYLANASAGIPYAPTGQNQGRQVLGRALARPDFDQRRPVDDGHPPGNASGD